MAVIGAATGDILVTLGDTLDIGDLDGAILDTGEAVTTVTTLTATEEEDLQLITEAETTLQTEVMLQTETL